jgi:intein-encoded DNA endonuclease-like protein
MRKFCNLPSEQVCQLYNDGNSLSQLAQIFNCSTSPIRNILDGHGIQMRAKGTHITYTNVNLDFFKSINSEANAYFLGFLYADGCVYVKNNMYTIRVELKSNDSKILEIFRNHISPSAQVRISKRNTAIFGVHQKEIAEQLISLGCTPRKSLILTFPNQIPDHLLSHFMRGYSDGDGCISKYSKNNKYTHFMWDFVSTKQFCEHFSKILNDKLQIKSYIRLCRPKTNKITSRLSVGGNFQVKKVLDWLYQDATIYLSRKYDKYLEIKNGKLPAYPSILL